MATNLLIGNCEIPLASSTTTFSASADTNYPLKNLFGGSRNDMFRIATAASGDHRLTMDLGASTTKTANFLYLAKAILLKNDDIATITVKAHTSDNYAAGTTVNTISSFSSATLVGPNSEDYISTFTESSAFRWWYVNYNATDSSQVPHSKVFLGKSFDPGRDPDENASVTRTRVHTSQRKAMYTFTFTWSGLSYSKTVTFHDFVSRKRRTDLFVLYTDSYHAILHGHRAILCRCLEFSAPPRATDYNDVTVTWEEVL